VMENLHLHIELGLQSGAPDESATLRLRLNELSGTLLELVAADADTADIEQEILSLQARLTDIEGTQCKTEQANEFLQDVFALAERCKHRLIAWDEKMIRQMVACVKVIDSERLLVIFGEGMEREVALA
ncbi:MAG: hypothetical protein FWC27_01620, partial [Firmicutes bacterium]|nr:hypothetical protein [Bacillota bacterium]